MQSPIAVVCVNYNGGNLLIKTIKDLFSNTNYPFKLYLVDNNSSDNSADKIKEEFPEIILIKSEENLGFGKGNNLALQKILKDGSFRYACLINSDLEFSYNWLTKLVEEFETSKFKNLGSLNPLIITKDEYYSIPIKISHNNVFFNSINEPRALKQIESKNILISPEKTETFAIRNLENKKFIASLGNSPQLLVNKNLSKLKLEILDPFMKGFSINIKNQEIITKTALESFRKKFSYFISQKFSRQLELPTYKIEFDVESIVSEFELNARPVINSLGGIWKKPHLPVDNMYGSSLDEVKSEQVKVDYSHGACMLISTRSLRTVGLFDPKFFMYYEDADLGVRLNKAGFSTVATPKVTIKHLEGGGYSELTSKFMLDSQNYFKKKYDLD